ncbi:hypothetical protein OAT76_05030 [Flavobacteriaceae bacterium]|nr:hypothetical protein [Flavobacteriaceae bacterium]
MNKKLILFLMLFFILAKDNYGQENKIKISPNNLLGTSSILLTLEDRGKYSLTIKNKTGDKILIKKFEIFDKNLFAFKYNFKNFDKGDYTFELSSKRIIIANKKFSKN